MYKSVWVVMEVDGEVLLLKRSKSANNPSLWNFPGGGVEKKETIKTSAVREVWEEAGIKIKESDLEFLYREEKSKRVLYFYRVKFDKYPTVKLNDESSKFKWVKWSKFPKNLHKPTKFYHKSRKGETASTESPLESLVSKVLDTI